MKIILLTSAVFYNFADARVVYSSTSTSGSSWVGGPGSYPKWCPGTQVWAECHQAPSAQKHCNTPPGLLSMTACYEGCGCPTGTILRHEGSVECIYESACGGFIADMRPPQYQLDNWGRNLFLQAAARGDITSMKSWNSQYPEMKTSRDYSGKTALMIVEESGNAAAFNYVSGIMTVVSNPAPPTWVNPNPSWRETQFGVPPSMSEHHAPRGWGKKKK